MKLRILSTIGVGKMGFAVGLALVLMGSGIVGWYLVGGETAPSVVEQEKASQPSGTISGETAVREINMTAFQFGFNPATVTVNKGDKVIIHLTSTDVPHGLDLDEFDIHIPPAPKGEVRTAEFIADKVGTFTYSCANLYCGGGHHRQLGQLIVK